MTAVTGLIPARFLTMIAHLVISITLFWTTDESVSACLPIDYTPEMFDDKKTQLTVALSLTVIFLAGELIGFMFGISMFIHLQGLLCNFLTVNICQFYHYLVFRLATCCHTSGAVATAFFMFESWPCYLYWYIWGFCSLLPFLTEIGVVLFVFVIRKTLL